MSANPKELVNLARTLHPRLLKFFKRYPPQAILPASANTSTPSDSNNAIASAADIDTRTDSLGFPNPFQCQKHPVTGIRHDPVFSLRRQAELVKLARQQGVEELLPFTVKGTQERMRRRAENGLRVKGTGVGQRVKGKESERTLKGRLEKRRQAMLAMPQMIQTWKERGHGRGWKKWPKK